LFSNNAAWAIRVYNERDLPEKKGANFLRDSYNATYANMHPWFVRKCADILLGMHEGKDAWKANFLYNEKIFPAGTVEKLIPLFTKIRDDLVVLLKSKGLDELVFM
jgi:hypothetical protein